MPNHASFFNCILCSFLTDYTYNPNVIKYKVVQMQQTLVIIVRQKTALLLSSLPETLSSYVVSFLPKDYST